jgi:Glycosyltransferase family 87
VAGITSTDGEAIARNPLLAILRMISHDRRSLRIYAGMVIGVFALAFGSAMIGAATSNHVQMGGDFEAYWIGASRMAGGQSPYDAAMLTGPIPAQGLRYLYPPLFAQLLIPLSWLPEETAAFAWFCFQSATLAVALYVVTSAGGVRSRIDRAIVVGLAFSLYLPIYDSLMKGNVEGPMALLIAIVLVGSERASGVAVAAAALIKVVPGFALAGLVARGRQGLIGFAAGCLVLAIPSMLLSPGAWVDYARVLPNMLAGSADYTNNLAPAGALVSTPELAPYAFLATAARMLFVGSAVALIGLSVWLARKPGGWPAALLAAVVASILAPGAIWYHYTVVLLPFALYAMPRASRRIRLGFMFGLSCFVVAVVSPIVSILAFASFTLVGLVALWPRRPAPVLGEVAAA